MAILSSFFLAALSIAGQTPSVDCKAFERTIDRALKTIASDTFPMDESPTNEVGINNSLLLISINLDLMRNFGCELPKEPIRGNEYIMAAVNCQIATINAKTEAIRRRAEFKVENIPSVCDPAKWRREIHDGDQSTEAPAAPPQ